MTFQTSFSATRIARAATLALGVVAIGAASLAWTPADARSAPESFADLAEKLTPAVVNISTAQTVSGGSGVPLPEFPPGSPFEEYFEEFLERHGGEQQSRKVQSLGSGFVIDPDGLVVTNNHVVEDADEVTVTFSDGETLDAEVLGRDPKTDLALLKVNADRKLPFVRFGDSEALRVGDWVMAIGNPFGLGGTVTAGILSARDRDINAGPYDAFLQTDASINRGNSGGPLFNMAGEVMGVNTAIISPTGGSIGIGFSIPATTATSVIDQLKEFGETRRGWLGVRIQTVTDDLAEGLGLEDTKGALVAGIQEGGPAVGSGLEAGDVIVKFDGKPVDKMRDLPRIVADTEVGKAVDVLVLRDGKEETYQVTLGRLEEADGTVEAKAEPRKPSENETLGLSLSSLNDVLRAQYEVAEDVDGVLVVAVVPGSQAAEKRVRPGDVIVKVAQENVTNPDKVEEQVARAKSEGLKSVLLQISRGGETSFVALRVEGS
ncbi:DegQ family serine endoprotease [Pyruvatibacter sp.]|uniref:DegQ family serine endoprotease n=1 Tax=unclassified Pyruvatibacter TaxID=2618840 RepID=UPI002968E3BE|nr:DegQ family serine endoprotease [Alphaproteobacteria bacterium]